MCKLFYLVYQHYIVLDCHGKAYYRLSAIYYLIIVKKIEIFHYFKKQNISSYKDYLKHFNDYGLDEKQFYYIMLFIKERENIEGVLPSKVEKKKRN